MKICTKCNENKHLYDFYFRKDSNKYRNECKECYKLSKMMYYKNNINKCKNMQKNYYIKNRDKLKNKAKNVYHTKKLDKNWIKQNRKRLEDWRKNNLHKAAAREAKRRARKLKATPKWLTKLDYININNIYLECRYKSNTGNTKYHVDHIIPLQGKEVCGLHVPWNLQILESTENIKKYNKIKIGE